MTMDNGRIQQLVAISMAQALGYAWGRMDESGVGGQDEAVAFACAYSEAKRHMLIRGTFMPNIRDAFETFRDTGQIVAS